MSAKGKKAKPAKKQAVNQAAKKPSLKAQEKPDQKPQQAHPNMDPRRAAMYARARARAVMMQRANAALPKDGPLAFTHPEFHSPVLHLAAEVPKGAWFQFGKMGKQSFIQRLKTLSAALEKKFGHNVRIRLFDLKSRPTGGKKLSGKLKRPMLEPSYNIMFMAVARNLQVFHHLKADKNYQEIFKMFSKQENHNIVLAQNVRRAGNSFMQDKAGKGAFLFNYFYMEDPKSSFAPVWDKAANRFAELTKSNNSYLIRPMSGNANFQFIEHSFWPDEEKLMQQLNAHQKELEDQVFGEFTKHHAMMMPAVYVEISRAA